MTGSARASSDDGIVRPRVLLDRGRSTRQSQEEAAVVHGAKVGRMVPKVNVRRPARLAPSTIGSGPC
jgi:hypothetical protein